jgi:hypothetical protein
MSQRGITSAIIEMVSSFAVCDGDKIILTKKNCELLSAKLAKVKRLVDKMSEKGGYTVIEDNGSEITAYRVNSFNQKLASIKTSSSGF